MSLNDTKVGDLVKGKAAKVGGGLLLAALVLGGGSYWYKGHAEAQRKADFEASVKAPEAAAAAVGQEQTVRFTVHSVKETRKGLIVNSGPFKEHKLTLFVTSPEARAKFAPGKTVTVKGTVINYTNDYGTTPEIVIGDPKQVISSE